MKRLIALALILILSLPALAWAEETDTLKIGVVTTLSGDFFTDMWGNNTTDMDVRALIHGYSTVGYNGEGNFALDETVVKNAQVTDGAQGRTYAFALHDGLKYSDGTPITARDYVFSALLLSDPRMTGLGSTPGSMAQIVGFEEYVSGVQAENDTSFSGVRLISDTEFSLTIKGDRLPYFYELALVDVRPFPIHIIAPRCEVRDDGEGAYLAGEFSQALLEQTVLDPKTGYRYYPSVSCGPYVLSSYDRETHIAELTINPEYIGNFEGKRPEISRLTILPVDQETMVAQLRAGELDLIHKISSGERIAEAMSQDESGEINTQSYLRAGLSMLSFSCEQGPTQSQNVRQAIAMCTDPQALVSEFLKGYGLVSYAYYGYGQWMASDNDDVLMSLARYTLNVNAAIGLLETDGWVLNADGEEYDDEMGGVRYRITTDGSLEKLSVRWAYPANTDAIASLKPMLETNMALAGFELTCVELPFDQLLRHYYRQEERGYEMFFMGTNFALTFDPYYSFATGEEYQGVFNTTGIRDEELMRLAADMRATEPDDMDGYLVKWEAFQQRFVEVLPLAPLYGNIYFDFFRPDLQSYYPSAHWGIGSALLYAYLGEYREEPGQVDGDVTLDGEVTMDDEVTLDGEITMDDEDTTDGEDNGDIVVIG